MSRSAQLALGAIIAYGMSFLLFEWLGGAHTQDRPAARDFQVKELRFELRFDQEAEPRAAWRYRDRLIPVKLRHLPANTWVEQILSSESGRLKMRYYEILLPLDAVTLEIEQVSETVVLSFDEEVYRSLADEMARGPRNRMPLSGHLALTAIEGTLIFALFFMFTDTSPRAKTIQSLRPRALRSLKEVEHRL